MSDGDDDAAAESRCPRCGNAFHCDMNDSGPCGCTGMSLAAALLAQLREHHDGCLRVACLAQLQAEALRAK